MSTPDIFETTTMPLEDESYGLTQDSQTLAQLHLDEDVSCSEDEEDLEAPFDGTADVRVESIPYVSQALDARSYKTAEFRRLVFELCIAARIDPWVSTIERMHLTDANLYVHKVSGSLTNAVFFISLISAEKNELAPTRLLRVYGPNSGTLVQRKRELHVLHMLSYLYGIGPAILATFRNGRIEEYIPSRALTPIQIRDPVLSQWIAMRMRDLHRVDVDLMLNPDDAESLNLPAISLNTPALEPKTSARSPVPNMSSSTTPSLTSAASSLPSSSAATVSPAPIPRSGSLAAADSAAPTVMPSPATSSYSASSTSPFSLGYSSRSGSTSSINSLLTLSDPLISPNLRPALSHQRSTDSFESFHSQDLRRPIRSPILTSTRVRHRRHNQHLVLGAWDNITRWTRKAREIIKETRALATPLLGVFPQGPDTKDIHPFASPEALLYFLDEIDLPRFENTVRAYRKYIATWERTHSRARRVFAHNDTQYGNLLLRAQTSDAEALPHDYRLLSVIDFEYASLNPNAYDIANHFCEWRANYHEEPSWSLSVHGPYPNDEERYRFFRAYLGTDSDAAITQLDAQVTLWRPISHAMWSIWGLIQAYEDILLYIDMWRSGHNKPIDVSFEYLLYARERLSIFYEEVDPLLAAGVP